MTENLQNLERTEQLQLSNSTAQPLTLWIEPWGHDFLVAPGDNINMLFSGLTTSYLEIEFKEDCCIIYSWPNSSISVFQNGNEIVSY